MGPNAVAGGGGGAAAAICSARTKFYNLICFIKPQVYFRQCSQFAKA